MTEIKRNVRQKEVHMVVKRHDEQKDKYGKSKEQKGGTSN